MCAAYRELLQALRYLFHLVSKEFKTTESLADTSEGCYGE